MAPTADDASGAAALAGVVDRPRLYEILESPLVRLCIVQGPSGSGKTTLLRSWVLHRGDRDTTVWVSLGDGIASRNAFWNHVLAVTERLGLMSHGTAEAVRRQLNAAVDPVKVASAVLASAGPVVLVLDAYEHLGPLMSEIDEDLVRLVEEAVRLRVMITTRSAALNPGRSLANGVTRVITLNDLALTTDEVKALIHQQAGINDHRLAASVAAATRGFPLTVRAAVLTMSQLGHIPRVDSIEWDAVVAAKLESLLDDAATVQFVSETCVPSYVDLALAQELSGREDASQLLDMLERNGFGRWIPYAQNRPVFQYVETIRDSFRARAKADADRFARDCVITAHWLLANEEVVDEALHFALEGGDYALADRVFVSVVISNPDSYISDRYLPVLRTVPEDKLTEYPMLAFGLGLALAANPHLRLEAPSAFRIAIASPVQPSYLEPSIDRFSLDSMRAIARRTAFEFPESALLSSAAMRLLDTMDPALLGHFGEHVGTILRQLSYSLLQGGRIDESLEAIERSISLCTSQSARNYSIVYSAGVSAFAGDIVRSRTSLATLDTDAWPQELRETYLNAMGIVADAFASLDSMDWHAAVTALRGTDTFASTAEFWPLFASLSVVARTGLGQARAEAHRVSRELSGPTPPGVGDNTATEHLTSCIAHAWINAGDHRSAHEVLHGQAPGNPYLASAHVALLLASGKDRDALDVALSAMSSDDHTIRTRAATQTFGSIAALRADHRDLATEWLNDAALAAEQYGPRMHLTWVAPRDRAALRAFSVDTGSDVLQRFLEVPPVARNARVELTSPLTQRELVVLQALVAHHSVRAIAAELVVSPHTVKSHLQSIYRKLGVSTRQGACDVASDLGLLPTAEEGLHTPA